MARVLAAVSAAVAGSASAIVVRHDVPDAAYLAAESDYPAVFSLFRSRKGLNGCIATVIDRRWAVTAAHCIQWKGFAEAVAPDGPGRQVEVAGQPVRIDRMVVHPPTDSGEAPDIALLHFATDVVHVAPLALHRASSEQGLIVVMPGWGLPGNGKSGLGPGDGLFRVAENRIDRVDREKLYWIFDQPGVGGRALTLEGISGPGDSGGPALLRTPKGWTVAGISSGQTERRDTPEGLYGAEEYFVRVSTFAPWIDRHIAAN